MNPDSRPNQILSAQEELAFEALGGLERVLVTTDQILVKHGVRRALFDANELRDLRWFNMNTHRHMAFAYNDEISLVANIRRLIRIIADAGSRGSPGAFQETIIKRLICATLDNILGEGKFQDNERPVTDPPERGNGVFYLDEVAIHVCLRPSEALIRDCAGNLQSGLKPLIITLDDGVAGTIFLLRNAGIDDRVDVLGIVEFLTNHLYKRSFFAPAEHEAAFFGLLNRYNKIVPVYDADPLPRICME
jgi:hypothetical protein